MQEKQLKEQQNKSNKETIVKIPVFNIPMMSDEQWNRLAYRNYLEREGVFRYE